jgi:uncharacterized membrane protein YbhN (UPF0104 family)
MKARWVDNRLLILRVTGTILAVALLIVLFHEEGWEEILTALKRISASEFLLALGSLLISRMFVVGRWHILLRSAKANIPFRKTTSLTFTGLFASNFLPTTIGGDVVRLTGAMRMGFDRAICLASLVADRLVGMAGMTIALPLGLIPFLSSNNSDTLQAIGLPVLARKFWDLMMRTFKTFSIWAKKPEALIGSLACTLGNMFFIFAAIYILINGLHDYVPFLLIAGLWSLTYFVTQVPISINGYGVQELSLSFLLARVGGMGNAESLTVAVMIRALFIFASLPGALFLPAIMEAVAVSVSEEQGK